MKTNHHRINTSILLFLLLLFVPIVSDAQFCDSVVPTFNVDLSGSPNMNWVSPSIARDGHCCGTSNPDKCLEFVITLHPSAIAVNFQIVGGAIPPGALFYQIDCGPITQVGEPICLDGPGPHTLTFCKPGNNENEFAITSYSEPIIGPDITLNAGCSGFIFGNYFDESTVNWTSVGPGSAGDYDYLLSCASGCDTTYLTAPIGGFPAFVDYQVCGMDVGGCNPDPVCDTIRVNFVSPVTVSLSAIEMSLCPEGTTTITALTNGGTAPYSYLWNTAETTSSINAGAGIYFVEVMDTSGCYIATDTIIITQNPLPLVNAGADQVICEGSLVTLSGAGAQTYVWDNGVFDGISFIQAVGTTTYTVTGTDVNGCTNTDQVDVTVNPLPIVGAGVDQTVCDGAAVTLSGSGAITYAWDNGVFDGIPFIQAVGTTTFTVTGTDANGCVNTDQVDVIVNALPVADAGVDQTVCVGTVVTLSGAGALSYTWDNGVMNATPFTPVVGTITYTVIGTDANGCSNTDQVDVTVNPLPVVNAGPDQAVCDGNAIVLNGSGAVSYVWNNGVVDGVPFMQGGGTTTYFVTGTDGNGCVNTDQVNVTVYDLPPVNAGLDQAVCDGQMVTLNGSGATTYSWDNGVFDGVPFLQGVGTTTYTVTGTDANGCVNTDQVDVTVNGLPPVDAGPDQTVCLGTVVTLSGSGALSYAWNNGVMNATPFTPAVGTLTYIVTGTDANGCVNTDQVDVTVNPLPAVDAGADQIACQGSAVTLNGAGAVTYDWNNGVIDGVPFGQAVGTVTYTVTGTDANGCVNTDDVEVTINALPIVAAGADQELCEESAVILSGSGAQTYVWDNQVFDGVPFVQAVGTVTYMVVGTDANGCSSNDQVDVTVNALPNVNAGGDETQCENTMITLSGSGAQSYVWNNAVLDGVPFTQAPGTVTYTVTGTDVNGCVNKDQVDVTINALPVVVAGPDVIVCDGSYVTLNGAGASSYAWSGGILDGVPFTPTVGQYQFVVTGTDINLCANNDTVDVTVHPNPIVSAGADQTHCAGTMVTLNAQGSPNLYWSNAVINNTPFAQVVGIVDYVVYDSLATGCTSSDTVRVEILPNPIVSANNAEVCEGEGAVLSGEGAHSYVWSGGVVDGIEFYPNSSGTYTVTGTALNGCSATAESNVIVHFAPDVSFKIDDLSLTTLNPVTSFTNLTTGASTYEWDFGDGSPINSEFEPMHTFPTDEAGEYEITLTAYSDFGCPGEAVKYIHVFQDYTIWVPNAFTPDGNGQNEIFKPILDGFEEDDFTLYIFNRWGDLIFESHDMEVGWDGTFAGQDFQVQDGVYTWKIIAGLKDSSDSKIFVGHVTLLK